MNEIIPSPHPQHLAVFQRHSVEAVRYVQYRTPIVTVGRTSNTRTPAELGHASSLLEYLRAPPHIATHLPTSPPPTTHTHINAVNKALHIPPAQAPRQPTHHPSPPIPQHVFTSAATTVKPVLSPPGTRPATPNRRSTRKHKHTIHPAPSPLARGRLDGNHAQRQRRRRQARPPGPARRQQGRLAVAHRQLGEDGRD
jgi:hypothetical protein